VIAVILAAGRGTRMGALTATTPKPLLSVGGKPIIEHILRGLHAAGVRAAALITGYLAERLEASLGDGGRLGLELTYQRQLAPEGTARALLLARDAVGDAPFVLSWGDVVVEPGNYVALINDFQRVPCDALLMVNAMDDPWQGAAVYLDDTGRVVRLIEKPPRGTSQTAWNNAGIFVFTPLIFKYAANLAASTRGEYELPQAVHAMIADGRTVRALPVQGFWSDLGTPADLAAADRLLGAS